MHQGVKVSKTSVVVGESTRLDELSLRTRLGDCVVELWRSERRLRFNKRDTSALIGPSRLYNDKNEYVVTVRKKFENKGNEQKTVTTGLRLLVGGERRIEDRDSRW